MKRKICVITGSRAEFGLMSFIIADLKSDPDVDLQIIVTGMHLSPEFGLTINEITSLGLHVDAKVEMLLSSDTATGISKSLGLGIISLTDALTTLKPDIVLILGDRFETFAAAQVALFHNIPIAHIHGGELTEGAVDDSIRHCITKLSHIHFTSAEEHKKRVIQLGEEPKRVFNVGAATLDGVYRHKLKNKTQLEQDLGFSFGTENLLITLHPETIFKHEWKRQIDDILLALGDLENVTLIFTKSNADEGGRFINSKISTFVSRQTKNRFLFDSLGHLNYLSIMMFVDGVVGNSSSGIIEAPSFKIGTLNIGSRQKKRLKASSVIDCQPFYQNVKEGLKRLRSNDFKETLINTHNPYGNKPPSRSIIEALKGIELNDICSKNFHDITIRPTK